MKLVFSCNDHHTSTADSFDPVEPDPIKPDLVEPDPAEPDHVQSDPVNTTTLEPDHVEFDPVNTTTLEPDLESDPVNTTTLEPDLEPVKADHAENKPVEKNYYKYSHNPTILSVIHLNSPSTNEKDDIFSTLCSLKEIPLLEKNPHYVLFISESVISQSIANYQFDIPSKFLVISPNFSDMLYSILLPTRSVEVIDVQNLDAVLRRQQ
ncbi:hypothetical protein Fcan01_20795 [Folsomia candida]|uniref:Uncharacterized protein n=1 Tax=Folsomia candida TaxID=158441 RepID=A0A226DHP7_FOLCA|nr:hypothetical protein Fcan01_20795 [Folsomia candida]